MQNRFSVVAARRQNLLAREFNNDEKTLEHMMFLNMPYTLTSQDVLRTLKSHIGRYKNFVYSTREAIVDFCRSCLWKA